LRARQRRGSRPDRRHRRIEQRPNADKFLGRTPSQRQQRRPSSHADQSGDQPRDRRLPLSKSLAAHEERRPGNGKLGLGSSDPCLRSLDRGSSSALLSREALRLASRA